MSDTPQEQVHWYALRSYHNRTLAPVVSLCERLGAETFIPERLELKPTYTDDEPLYERKLLLPNLLFVRATHRLLGELRQAFPANLSVYRNPGCDEPAAIDDRAMEIFMLVVKTGARCLEAVDLPMDKGDKVRVTGGLFKGAEGYIRRVHGTKRFVVAIEGVAAVAVTHVPRQFLERVGTIPCAPAPAQTEHRA